MVEFLDKSYSVREKKCTCHTLHAICLPHDNATALYYKTITITKVYRN